MNITDLIKEDADCNNQLNLVDRNILRLLYENRGEIVSRDQLLDCWGDRIVADGSLNVSIKKIREVLIKHGYENLILTYPRRGYMLLKLGEIIDKPIIENENKKPSKKLKIHTTIISVLLGLACLTFITFR